MPARIAILAAPLALAIGALVPAMAVGAPSSGRIQCRVQENGEPASGTMTATPKAGRGKAIEGSCDAPHRIAPGTYEVTVHLDGALDRPSKKETIEVRPGRIARVPVNFSTGTLRVQLETEGRRAAGLAVIYRDGKRIGTLGSGVSGHLSTGTYDVVVRHRTDERRFEDVTIRRGQKRTVKAEF
ncbi:MAG: hypothetical protein ACOCXM_06295 [Myxococcota bacterium]